MRIEDCYLVGQVRKAHGIKGEVKAYFDVDHLEEYLDMESVYLLKDDKLTPFFIEQFRTSGADHALLRFRGVFDRTQAESLYGMDMFLPLDTLPELDAGQFYYHEVIGYTVEDENLGTLGKVKDFYETPHQDLMVMLYQGIETLIPTNHQIVIEADQERKVVLTRLPEGFLDIYL